MRVKSLAVATGLAFLSALTTFNVSLAAPPAKAFGELPKAYDAAISPDGKELVLIVNVKGVYGILAQKVDGSTQKP